VRRCGVLLICLSSFAFAFTAAAEELLPPGYDPYKAPIPDRIPDDWVDGRPYWLPQQQPPAPTAFVRNGPYLVHPAWEFEIGARYFPSWGTTQKSLYGFPPLYPDNVLVSRLTYSDLFSHAGEVFGRFEHASGFFARAFAGLGNITGGSLQDEDFPPAITPYSSTQSVQRNGRLNYATADFGWIYRTRTFGLSLFAGYHYYSEQLHAFGCIQTASNPGCMPSVPNSVAVITESTHWHAVRFGLGAESNITSALKLSGEVAYIPYVVLSASDTHHLRSDLTGSTPETGSQAASIQLEALLKYTFTNGFSIGAGGRYWLLNMTHNNAAAHFENTAVGGFPQSLGFKSERWGLFLQSSYRFGQIVPRLN
jgi:hypothetical protein